VQREKLFSWVGQFYVHITPSGGSILHAAQHMMGTLIMKKALVISLIMALALIVHGGSNASAQTVPPLWSGGWYGDSSKPSDWYKFNDAIISTGAHRLHAIGITGQGLVTEVVNEEGGITDG
jgi:hypothetical protein